MSRLENEIIENWNTDSKALVSVICPTYNQEDFLSQTIESILIQETDFPFEIIIHDDASTDNTKKIIHEYCSRYPKIIRAIIQEENQYQKGKRILEIVITHAEAEFIAICEGDDIWVDKKKLQKQIKFLMSNKDYVITYHDSIPFDESGVLDMNYGGTRKDLSSLELQQAKPINTLTACFKNVIRVFPPEYSAARFGDLFLWSLLGAHGKGKYMADILPAHYRVHKEGVFSTKHKKIKREMALVTDAAMYAYYRRVNNQQLAEYFKEKTLMSVILSYGLILAFIKVVNFIIRKLFIKI